MGTCLRLQNKRPVTNIVKTAAEIRGGLFSHLYKMKLFAHLSL